jgi:hypothetical protein
VAALIRLADSYLIANPASWLEMPVLEGVSLSPVDLLCADRYDLVCDLMRPNCHVKEVLDEFDGGWRETLVDGRFEAALGHDGQLSIQPRRGDDGSTQT